MTEFEKAALEELRAIRLLLEEMPNRLWDEKSRRVSDAVKDHLETSERMRSMLRPPRFP